MKVALSELLQLVRKSKLGPSSLLREGSGKEQLSGDGKADLMYPNLSTRLFLVN